MKGKRSLDSGLLRRASRRALSGAYSINDKTTFRGGVGRSYGRVTVISGTAATSPASSDSTSSPTADYGVTPTFMLDQGTAVVSAAAADRSGVLEQQRRRLLERR